ncbi:MAG TPA: hypothetical protein VHO72_13050 [Bacteroidales bacterium]|nr:hypothetical protein [Bacteroidales bacterium]
MCGRGSGSGSRDPNIGFLRQLNRFVGETVTIFTTSGGASGCGFTGVILSVNTAFVRLVTEFGDPPGNPLAENICGDMDNGMDLGNGRGGIGIAGIRDNGRRHSREVGSVVDIPVDRIAAFNHNAI